MELGRDGEKLLKRLVEATEKNAEASQALIDLAKEEREIDQDVIAPGFCPHCSTMNPVVRSEGGAGRMNDFVLVAACNECGKIIYAVNNGFSIFTSREHAQELLEERKQGVKLTT